MGNPHITRLGLKIVLTMIGIAVLELLVSFYLVNRVIDESLNIGLNPNVKTNLDEAAGAYKELLDLHKKVFNKSMDIFASGSEMGEAAYGKSDADAARQVLCKLKKKEKFLKKLSLIYEDGAEIASCEKEGNEAFPDENWLKYAVRKPVAAPDPSAGMEKVFVEGTFVVSKSYMRSFEQAQTLAETYKRLDVDGIRRAYAKAFLVILGLVIVLATGVGIYMSHGARVALSRLVAATAKVSAGDLDFSLRAETKDEIGDLTSAFNRMVAELKSSRERIGYLERISAWQEVARRLAHEIKNPLTPIRLAVQELRRRYDGRDEEFANLLDQSAKVVEEEVNTLKVLVEEFSGFAKLPDLNPAQCDLNEIVESVLAANPHFGESADIGWEKGDDPITAMFDKVLIRQVLINLVRNGIQAASAKGRPCIIIRTHIDRKARTANLFIGDNGPGIPADQRHRIFDPYFTTKEGGMGLGLAIVKKIVLMHGGEITADNRPAGGAEFKINIPIRG